MNEVNNVTIAIAAHNVRKALGEVSGKWSKQSIEYKAAMTRIVHDMRAAEEPNNNDVCIVGDSDVMDIAEFVIDRIQQ